MKENSLRIQEESRNCFEIHGNQFSIGPRMYHPPTGNSLRRSTTTTSLHSTQLMPNTSLQESLRHKRQGSIMAQSAVWMAGSLPSLGYCLSAHGKIVSLWKLSLRTMAYTPWYITKLPSQCYAKEKGAHRKNIGDSRYLCQITGLAVEFGGPD